MNFDRIILRKRTGFGIAFIVLLSVSSCYEPEEYVPPVYLEPMVNVTVDNVGWNGISDAGVTINFQNNQFSIGILSNSETEGFGCLITGKDSHLFEDDYALLSKAIKKGNYRTNDSLTVTFYFNRSKDDRPISKGNLDQWDDTDAENNVLVIEDVYEFEDQTYVSGSFSAKTFRSFDNTLSPAFRIFDGTFENIRIKEIYFKRNE